MIFTVNYSNAARTTRMISYGDPPAVSVTLGAGSYLVNGSLEFGGMDCHVLIGRYCALAHRMFFLIGMDHNYHNVTSYPFANVEHTDLAENGIMHNHNQNHR